MRKRIHEHEDTTVRAVTAAGSGPGVRGGTRSGDVPEATIHDIDERNEDTDAAIAELWTRYVDDRAPELRDRLILHYAPLVKYVAGRVGSGLPAHVEQADLISYGTLDRKSVV